MILQLLLIVVPTVLATNDICTLPKVVGPCEALIQRFYYKSSTERCEKFTYGGCQGNANNFPDRTSCRKSCVSNKNPKPIICSLPPKTGPCRGSFRRYFFNTRSGRCHIFTYGGCQGSANNFKTVARCRSVCGHRRG